MPVIPATQEAEEENCLNLGGGDCSELRSHNFTPDWVTELDSILKTKQNTRREDFQCSYHKEIINVQCDGYAKYPYLVIIHCIHRLTYHSVSQKYV